MRIKNFKFSGYNGCILNAILWLPECTPRKIVQVTHGMTEHIGRYSDLAKALTLEGFALAGFDLRGHGYNAVTTECASLGTNGWDYSIEDMFYFFNYLEYLFPGVPHYMMGFSLGSFLLRDYLSRYPRNIAGAILMGTGCQSSIVLSILMLILKIHAKVIGFNDTSDLVRKLSFETYNSKFKPNETSFDWLCSDKKELDKYLDDQLCKKDISVGLLYQLLSSMKRTGNDSTYYNWKKSIPVLLLSGADDPVGNFGKGIVSIRDKMIDNKMDDVSMYILPDSRHDILHEKENGIANHTYDIILRWLN